VTPRRYLGWQIVAFFVGLAGLGLMVWKLGWASTMGIYLFAAGDKISGAATKKRKQGWRE
jgi:hypothetical protein